MAAGSNVAFTNSPPPPSSTAALAAAVKPYRTYPELDALLLSLGLLDPDDDDDHLLSAPDDTDHDTDHDPLEEPAMLRSFVIPARALSALSRPAVLVASARDIRDHFPTRHTLEPALSSSSNGLHTLSQSPSRPSTRILIFPQNLRRNSLPTLCYGGSPSPGPSYTNRATSPEPQPAPPPANAPESTTVTDSEDPATGRTFQYNISVSYVSKSKRWDPSNVFNFSPYKRVAFEENWAARKRSRPKTGQDAFFVSRVSDTGAVAFGVADGVGGYSMNGIDSADFSHTLCEDMAEVSYHSEAPMAADMLIEAGYLSACNNPNIAGGGSTACVGVAKPDGMLEAANLGDSGFVILRAGRVHHTSQPQTHAFNTPFQLSVISQEVVEQARKFGGPVPISDRPRDAAVEQHELQHGDVIIFATDGLWDNLSAQDVLRLVSNEMVTTGGWVESGQGIQVGPNLSSIVDEEIATPEKAVQSVIARKVASRAKDISVNTKIDGPFAKEVRRYFPGEVYHGGKRDDICVLCCVVVEWAVPAVKTTTTTETTTSESTTTTDSTTDPPPKETPPPPPPTVEKQQAPPAPPKQEEPPKVDAAAYWEEPLRGILPGGGGPGAPSPRL
ncbi:hypothetical protein Dda_7559 [Drechslerella dactyloides]|uniref:Protein phosphatase n=1 Tax=Drechslerella dactyloides TaxID=74499 RepID=A0AAD6NGU1_DREDA|nr:hypothetical protein Dda_7559 [Drechslerella dactyloides]